MEVLFRIGKLIHWTTHSVRSLNSLMDRPLFEMHIKEARIAKSPSEFLEFAVWPPCGLCEASVAVLCRATSLPQDRVGFAAVLFLKMLRHPHKADM